MLTQKELNKGILCDLLHEHLIHDDSGSVLIHNDDYNLMSYEETEQGFNLTFSEEVIGTIEPLEGDQFKFEAVSDTLETSQELIF